MAAIDLTTTAAVKAWIVGQGNQIGSTDDALFNRLVTAASAFVLGYCSRPTFITQSYQDIFEGRGQYKRVLKYGLPDYANAPASAVTTVKVGSVTIPQSTDRVMNGWILVNGVVILRGYAFESKEICEVDYSAGYADAAHVSFDLAQAVIELVALKYRRRKNVNLVSESLQGMTTAYSQKDVTDDIRSVLDRYKQNIIQ